MAASPESPDPSVALQNAVTDLNNAARIPTKQRAVKVTSVINTVASKAYENGLVEGRLEELVDIITLPSELDQASITILINNLYPAGRVSDNVVLRVVGSLGHGKARVAFPAQAALLKWLIMVYDVLENQKILSQLYSILFNLLDTIAIRAPLCHLLSLITRRKHVRPFRIQMLLELARRVGNEPPLIGLIRVYKDYYPDVIVGDVTSGRASVFRHPNAEWKKRLTEIQEQHAQKAQDTLQIRQQAFRVRRGTKGGKLSALPEVHTSHAHETSVTLEEVEDVNEFIQKLEKIELPNQLVAVIGDPLLQNLLQLKSNDAILRRIDNWLTAFFEDQLEGGAQSGSTLLDMLAAIREYAAFTKTLPPACTRYLQSLLEDWNGVEGRELVLELLTYLPVAPFEELYESTFQPLESAILDEEGTPETQFPLLQFYTSILRRWTVTLLSSSPAVASSAMTALVTHVNKLALNLLQTSPTTIGHDHILQFYEITAFTISQHSLQPHVRIITPPSTLIYTLHFAPSLATLSRLCAILAIYKRAFESAMSKAAPAPAPDPSNPTPPAPQVESYPKDYVNLFNGFLMDICNCVWRSRAFNKADTNALGCLLPEPLLHVLTTYVARLDTGLALPSLFSLSYSPVLCNLSISYVRELEDKATEVEGAAAETAEGATAGAIQIRHAGPVTQLSLGKLGRDGGLKLSWPNYRLGVLKYLEGKSVVGVGELMHNTLKHLMTARRGAAKT